MRFVETALAGVVLIELEPIGDDRGFFARTFDAEEFARHGLEPAVAQCNLSYNARRGTLRGLHYQDEPAGEDKLIRCVAGAMHAVVVDARPESPTYLSHISVDLAITIIGTQILYYLFVMYGAWKMSDMESHGLAIVAAILAMLPVSGCCVLGLPLGIWALAVLGDPDVRVAMKTRGIRRY